MLKALADFSVTFTDAVDVKRLLSFREGDLITNPRIIDYIILLNCPAIPVGDTTTVICPRCSTMFDSTQHSTTAMVTLANAATPHAGQFFSYTAGQIVEHSWLIETLKAADVPLETVTVTKCPNAKCGHIFR